jgi:membrane protein
MSALEKLDAAQKRSRAGSIAMATVKKFSEDSTTNLAAMVAFWAFFSIFPLLMVLVAVLGYVLPASEKAGVLDKVAEMFPLLSAKDVAHLTGAWWALLVGGVSALWSGIGAVRTMQTALNSVWEVPYHKRPHLREQILRSLAILATIGVGLVLTTLISGYVTSSANDIGIGVGGRIAGYVISILLDIGLFIAAFRMLTERPVSLRDVLPGALLSGIVFFVLQELSAFIIARHLHSAQSTYGHFATVITFLWWFYLQAIVTLLGAQLNVVLKERLYPRSLVHAPQTEADHRALEVYARERTYQPEEKVTARVERPPARP